MWLAVLIAGAIGGFLGSLVGEAGVPVPPTWARLCPEGSGREVCFQLVRGPVCGALAGLLLWALNAPQASIMSTDIDWRQVAASCAVGLAGVRIMAGWAKQAQVETTAQALAEAIQKITAQQHAAPEESAHDRGD